MWKTIRICFGLLIAAALGCSQPVAENQQRANVSTGKARKEDGPRVGGIAVRPLTAPVPWATGKGDTRPAVPVQSRGVEGKVKTVDGSAHSITVTSGGQDQTLQVDPSAFIVTGSPREFPVPGGLAGVRVGSDVQMTTYKKDGQELVSFIKMK